MLLPSPNSSSLRQSQQLLESNSVAGAAEPWAPSTSCTHTATGKRLSLVMDAGRDVRTNGRCSSTRPRESLS